jgi:hypothetical protein
MEVLPMNGRVLTAVVVLMFLALAAFIAGPAVSGEHPWDSDKDGGKDTIRSGGGGYYESDSVIVVYDSVKNTIAGCGRGKPVTPWFRIFKAIWGSLII